MKQKPAIRYDPKAEGTYIELGEKAQIRVLNHPLAPNTPTDAVTTRVIEIGGKGVFQTKNTIYVPDGLSEEWFETVTGKFEILPVREE